MEACHIINMVFICVAMFFGGLSLSLLSPFYPHEALKKGVTVSESGVVVGAIFITTVLSSPVCGRYIHKIGAKNLLGLGAAICGVGNIIFGLLSYVEEKNLFFGLSVIIRIFTAIGESAISAAAYPLAANQVKRANEGKAMAVSESFFGIGTMLGASVGGLLYDVAGFSVPFYFCGGILLASTALSSCFFADKKSDTSETTTPREVSWTEVLRSPGVICSIFGLVMGGSSRSWYAASLEPFLNNKFNMTPAHCGMALIGPGFSYTIFTPLFGFIIDLNFAPLKVMILGNVIIVATFLLMGPVPQLIPYVGQTMWGTVTSLAIQGIGTAAIFLGSLMHMMQGTSSAGLPGSEQVKGMVSSLWLLGVCMGSYLGTTLGSIFYDSLGFEASALVESAAISATIGILIVNYLSSRMSITITWHPEQVDYSTLQEDDEQQIIVRQDGGSKR